MALPSDDIISLSLFAHNEWFSVCLCVCGIDFRTVLGGAVAASAEILMFEFKTKTRKPEKENKHTQTPINVHVVTPKPKITCGGHAHMRAPRAASPSHTSQWRALGGGVLYGCLVRVRLCMCLIGDNYSSAACAGMYLWKSVRDSWNASCEMPFVRSLLTIAECADVMRTHRSCWF